MVSNWGSWAIQGFFIRDIPVGIVVDLIERSVRGRVDASRRSLAADKIGHVGRRTVENVPHARVVDDCRHAHALDLITENKLDASVGTDAVGKGDILSLRSAYHQSERGRERTLTSSARGSTVQLSACATGRKTLARAKLANNEEIILAADHAAQ